MERNMIKIGSFDIEYVRGGTGRNKILVFAHGLGGNLDQWRFQLQHFEKDYNVLAFSLQGHGNSSNGSGLSDYSIHKYCEIVLQLLDRLDIKECTWIGNSMGGVVGFEVMRQSPGVIKMLITNGTTPKLSYSYAGLKLIYIMDKLLIRSLGYERYVGIAVKASLKDAEKRIWLKELFMAAHPEAILMSHQLLGDYDYRTLIKEIPTPIVVVKTPDDSAINKYLDKESHWLKTQDNVLIEEKSIGGHLVNMEHPETYNEWIEGCIR